MRKNSLWFDIIALGLLIFAAAHFGLWYMQQVWAQQGATLPATEFTDGHLIGTTVGMHELLEGRLDKLYTISVGYPDGLIFRPLMWPAILMGLIVGPVLSLNYIFTYMSAFNAIGGYLAARSMRIHPIGALASGVMFGWNPWVRETMGNGQFEQSAVGVIGLIWASAFLCEKRPKLGMFFMFLTVAGCGVAVPNCTLAGLLALPVFAVFRVLQKNGRWRRWALAIGAAVLAGLIVNHYQSINFEQTQPQFFRPRQVSDKSMISQATLTSLVTAPEVNSGQHHVLHLTYLGQTWMAAGILALVIGGLPGLMAVITAVFMAHFALGPSVVIQDQTYYLPMAWLQEHVRILSRSGSFYRFVMGAYAAFSIAAAVACWRASRVFWPLGIIGLIGFGYFSINETNTLPGHQPPIPYRVAYWNKELSALKGGQGAVIDLPLLKGTGCDKNSFRYINPFWLHRRPYLHTMEPPVAYRSNERDIGRLQRALDKDNCSDLVPKHIQSMNVGAVVVHKEVICALTEKQIQCLRDAFGPPQEYRRIMFWDGLLKSQ